MKNVTICLLIIITAWLAFRVIDLENYRYANSIGMCTQSKDGAFYFSALELVQREKCLYEAETRTSPHWHLLYGLKVL